MIKRRFYKIDHGDRDASDPSSSSSDEDHDNAIAEVKHDDDDDEVGSTSSGYKSEDSSANDVDVNSTGLLFSEDDAGTITERPGTITERPMLINKELPSEYYSDKSNDLAEKKPLPTDMPYHVLKFKSVFKCRICPRIICLTEDTLHNHLQSKRHARSEKLHREGRLKAILNSDGEIENQEVSEIQTEDTEDDMKKSDRGQQQQHKKRFRKKKSDNANTRKMRSTKGPAKRRRKK